MGQVEHRHIQRFTALAAGHGGQQGVTDGALGEYLQLGGGGVRCGTGGDGGQIRERNACHANHRQFAVQQFRHGRALESEAQIAVGTAGVVGVGGGDQSGPPVAFIHHQGLAVVGLEIEQGQVAAQGDLAGPHGVGQPAPLVAVAQPLTADPPDPGPARIGVA